MKEICSSSSSILVMSLALQCTSGGVLSRTVTICVALELLFEASVAVQVRSMMMELGPPSLKCTSKATLGFSSHSSVAVTSGVGMPFAIEGGTPFSHSSVTSAGTPTSTGAVTSGLQSEISIGVDPPPPPPELFLVASACIDKSTDNVMPNKAVNKHFILSLLM